jgi:hypothetical protein
MKDAGNKYGWLIAELDLENSKIIIVFRKFNCINSQ